MWLSTVQTVLLAVLQFVETCWLVAAIYLEGPSPGAALLKDFLFALVIAVAASSLVNRYAKRRERNRRARLTKPIRDLVINAVISAHSDVFEELLRVDDMDNARMTRRVNRLSDNLSRVRAVLGSTLLGGFDFFEDDQKAELANYFALVDLTLIARTRSAVLAKEWVLDLNSAFSNVKRCCEGFAKNMIPWTADEIKEVDEIFDRRLEPGLPARNIEHLASDNLNTKVVELHRNSS